MSRHDEHAERFRDSVHRMAKNIPEESPAGRALSRSRHQYISSGFFISALKVCGWAALLSGIIGSVWIWSNVPDARGVLKELRAQFIMSAIASAVQGFITWILFNVVAMMAENLEMIRENTSGER